jgi:DNA modification methylase
MATQVSSHERCTSFRAFVIGCSEPKISDYIEDIIESQHPDNTIDQGAEPEHIISKLTVQGDVVLDPLMGTRTTGIAAVKLKRRLIGIEKNPDKLLTAKGRISDFLGQHNEGEEKTD